MKTCYYFLILCCTFLISSCIIQPILPKYDEYLCRINADGTGFEQLCSSEDFPFYLPELWDMYVTRNGNLIMATDRYLMTDPDSLNWISFSENPRKELHRIAFSNQNKAYFCEKGNLCEYDLLSNSQTVLVPRIDKSAFMYPSISSDDSIITVLKKSLVLDIMDIAYYSIADDSIHYQDPVEIQFPLMANVKNFAYNTLDHMIYGELCDGIYTMDIDFISMNLFTYISMVPFHYSKYFELSSQDNFIINVDGNSVLKIFQINPHQIIFTQQLDKDNCMVKVLKNSTKVFYVLDGSICYYDLDTRVVVKVPNTSGVKRAMCPTWTGQKIYYFKTFEADN